MGDADTRVFQERAVRPWLQADCLYWMTSLGREQRRVARVLQSYGDQVVSSKMAEARRLREGRPPPVAISQADADEACFKRRKRLAFLDMVVASGEGLPLTKDEVRAEVYTLMAAGNETTANSLSFTLALLGLHPEWLEAAHREVDDVFAGDDYHRPATTRDLSELRVLERIIKESLRLFPVAPLHPRFVPVDMELGAGPYKVPRGCCAIAISYLTHRLPEFYPEPHKFDPDRFLPENSAGRHPYCYIPFGAGLRNCVGGRYAMLQMKTVLATLLRRFTVLPGSTREDLEDLQLSIVLHPVNGMRVTLQRREHGPALPEETSRVV